MGMALWVARVAMTSMLEHAVSEHPREACGLLSGLPGGAVNTVWRMNNVATHPLQHYALDPEQHLHCLDEMERVGERLMAVYHSHTDGSPAYPSETDIDSATQVVPYIILGVNGARAYHIMGGRVTELRMIPTM